MAADNAASALLKLFCAVVKAASADASVLVAAVHPATSGPHLSIS
jgi:hypothetical protein